MPETTFSRIFSANFFQHEKNKKWCHENFLNYKGLMRAVEIREQLKRLLKKFNIPMVSCEGRTYHYRMGPDKT